MRNVMEMRIVSRSNFSSTLVSLLFSFGVGLVIASWKIETQHVEALGPLIVYLLEETRAAEDFGEIRLYLGGEDS